MRISWFRPDLPGDNAILDSVGHLIAGLAGAHDVRLVTRASAHDELWRLRRGLVDLPVYELTGATGDAYLWPYLVRYPGLALVLGRQTATGHRADLVHRGRREDADAERAFVRAAADGPLAIPLHCSRGLAVVAGSAADGQLRPQDGTPDPRLRAFHPAMAKPDVTRVPRTGALRVGLIAPDAVSLGIAGRALERARAAGAAVELLVSDDASRVLTHADALASVAWPPAGGLAGDVLAAQAMGIPAIVMESADTALLPALDPQTWQARDRGPGAPAPVAVSLDPRDQEHSLMLALRQLAADERICAALGAAAAARWALLHEPSVAARGFAPILDAARNAPAPTVPPGWPEHFRADASGTARRILGEFGLAPDIFA